MRDRVRAILEKVGMSPSPEKGDDALLDYGFDSLMMVLIIAELEKEFKIKIPASTIDEEIFSTLDSLEKFAKERGAK